METRILDIPVILPEHYEDCERCLGRLQDALVELEGVKDVEVDQEHSTITLTFDRSLVSLEQIEGYARQVGVEIVEKYQHEVTPLLGLDCPDCAVKIERQIGRMPGVLWASVNYATSMLAVEYESGKLHYRDIVERVKGLGYDVAEERGIPEAAGAPFTTSFLRNRRAVLTLIAGLCIAAGLILQYLFGLDTAADALYLVALVAGGIYPARSGLYAARSLSFDTNFLMTVAALGAIALGQYVEGAAVMFLFSLGSTLESYTVDRTRNSIRSLVNLSPNEALRKHEDHEDVVPVQDLKIGDVIIIKPGERIPMDGIVAAGTSSVDESAITGESVPVEKNLRDSVYAGTVNQRGAIEVRVTRLAEDNTLSKIIHLVEEAQAQKAPSQRFSERFGEIYTPVVIGIAVLVATLPTLAFGLPFAIWFKKALILLVVSCPCALVISTPVAIVAAIGNAAKRGVLIKGGAYLEEMGSVSVVAFDKTGTLTTGQLEITEIIPLNSYDPRRVLEIAATIESRSEHPLADAVLRKAEQEDVSPLDITYFEAIPGKGARAVVGESVYYVGNQRLLDDLKLTAPHYETLVPLAQSGKTLMYVGVEEQIIGIIAAADRLKDTSADAVAALKDAGVTKTVMLTGDNPATARAVADVLGIDEVRAELLPEDKVEAVRELVRTYRNVAMVGDGINDAPALAAATVGVAMGGAGTHAALETADIALMADDLSKLPYGLDLSRKSLRIIKQNLTFAMFVVFVLIASALLGWINLAGGVFGHEGSALLVIANSMRLLRMRGGLERSS